MIYTQRDETLWVYSMGKRFAVTAIATTDDEANAFMRRNPEECVIAVYGPFIVLAHKHQGVRPEVAP